MYPGLMVLKFVEILSLLGTSHSLEEERKVCLKAGTD